MNCIVWTADLHSNCIDQEMKNQFFTHLKNARGDAILVGGDISDGARSLQVLEEMALKTGKTIYFVLGNHDYYGESIATIRRQAIKMHTKNPHTVYLTRDGVVSLDNNTVLIGCDGWGDAKEGSSLDSTIVLNDFSEIEDFRALSPEELEKKLQELGDEAAADLALLLERAFSQVNNVLFLTHVPPFKSVCYFANKGTDRDWNPYFVCKSTGDVLMQYLSKNPQKQCVVLCGHSHAKAFGQILPNLQVYVLGRADEGLPNFELLEIPKLFS